MGSKKFQIKRPERTYQALHKKYNQPAEGFSLSRMIKGLAVAGFIVLNGAILIISLTALALMSTLFESGSIFTLHQEAIDQYSYTAVDYMVTGVNDGDLDFDITSVGAVANIGDEEIE